MAKPNNMTEAGKLILEFLLLACVVGAGIAWVNFSPKQNLHNKGQKTETPTDLIIEENESTHLKVGAHPIKTVSDGDKKVTVMWVNGTDTKQIHLDLESNMDSVPVSTLKGKATK